MKVCIDMLFVFMVHLLFMQLELHKLTSVYSEHALVYTVLAFEPNICKVVWYTISALSYS